MVPFWASGPEFHCLPSRRIQERVKVYALFTPTTFLRTDPIGEAVGVPSGHSGIHRGLQPIYIAPDSPPSLEE